MGEKYTPKLQKYHERIILNLLVTIKLRKRLRNYLKFFILRFYYFCLVTAV